MNAEQRNAQALMLARGSDPDACHAYGAPDVLLVNAAAARDLLALYPGSWEDPNPVSGFYGFTRIVLPDLG